MKSHPLDGWHRTSFTHSGIALPVYVQGKGSPILVMHEIPNLHPGVIRFGQHLAQEGFEVWMPSVLGSPGAPPSGAATLRSLMRVCITRDFTWLALRRTSPMVEWMRALARHASQGRPVGAIGMCLTGGFALAMAVEPSVVAPVLSQPSLPFPLSPLHLRDVNLDPADLDTVKQRCRDEGLCVLGLRFSHDALAPGARFQRLREELGDHFLSVELDSSWRNPHGHKPWAHSVLGVDYDPRPGSPTHQAEAKVVSFFRERLT